jgi:hypothetical protein
LYAASARRTAMKKMEIIARRRGSRAMRAKNT